MGLGDLGHGHDALLAKPVEHGGADMVLVDLEVAAKRRAGVAAAEAVGSQGNRPPGTQRATISGSERM